MKYRNNTVGKENEAAGSWTIKVRTSDPFNTVKHLHFIAKVNWLIMHSIYLTSSPLPAAIQKQDWRGGWENAKNSVEYSWGTSRSTEGALILQFEGDKRKFSRTIPPENNIIISIVAE